MEEGKIKSVLFMGPTGSGKGTQAKLLAEKTGYKIFSSGDKFRELRQRQDDLGARIREEYDKGLLMPAWFASLVFQEELIYAPSGQGIIFEGTARTLAEAQHFNEVSAWLQRDYVAVCLNIGEEESMKRQIKRAQVEHRPDSDTPEKIHVRFAEFNKHTAPAIDFLRSINKVIEIDGEQSIEQVFADILAKLGEKV